MCQVSEQFNWLCGSNSFVDRKGASDYASSFLTGIRQESWIQENSGEIRLLTIIVELDRVTNNLTGVELVLKKDPLMSWIPRHATNCVSRCRIMGRWSNVWSASMWKNLNVLWWSLVSQYTSDQLVRTTRCEKRPEIVARCLCGTSREIWC